jgi:hypothetical protein
LFYYQKDHKSGGCKLNHYKSEVFSILNSTFVFWLDAFPSPPLFPQNRVFKTAGISDIIMLCTYHSVLCRHSEIIALESTWHQFELGDSYHLTIQYVPSSWYSWNTPKSYIFETCLFLAFRSDVFLRTFSQNCTEWKDLLTGEVAALEGRCV